MGELYEVDVELWKKDGRAERVVRGFATRKARTKWLEKQEADDKLKNIWGFRNPEREG
jgi:hypothetical protein